MLKPTSKVVRVRVEGPLVPHQQQLALILAERGYTPLTRVRHFQVMAHLSQWLVVRRLDVAAVRSELLKEYLAQRRMTGIPRSVPAGACGRCWMRCVRRGAPLTDADPGPGPSVDELLAGYARFLAA